MNPPSITFVDNDQFLKCTVIFAKAGLFFFIAKENGPLNLSIEEFEKLIEFYKEMKEKNDLIKKKD